ncbi:BgTH12-03296 [Blumeria graminis f. sp. triticale]|uniref:BgTH12-03296 n=1 Tax=Blumeria graminis f. sp. triticale TaxID=1689686 RepID=A0A9W4D4B8_BLUGR|nr:BgTH12-03296 [Blumeria graminis f. sp. triticale]
MFLRRGHTNFQPRCSFMDKQQVSNESRTGRNCVPAINVLAPTPREPALASLNAALAEWILTKVYPHDKYSTQKPWTSRIH